jgi:hypothetical protein
MGAQVRRRPRRPISEHVGNASSSSRESPRMQPSGERGDHASMELQPTANCQGRISPRWARSKTATGVQRLQTLGRQDAVVCAPRFKISTVERFQIVPFPPEARRTVRVAIGFLVQVAQCFDENASCLQAPPLVLDQHAIRRDRTALRRGERDPGGVGRTVQGKRLSGSCVRRHRSWHCSVRVCRSRRKGAWSSRNDA